MAPQDFGARVLATTEMEDAAAEEGDAAVTTMSQPPTCPVCMEPWTCDGDHRICCIPCGHVYGRSCLERWLHRSAHDTAKCPQCGEQFEDKLITKLYAPGNLWDGCCHLQEQEYKSIIVEMEESLSIVKGSLAIIESRTGKLRAHVKKVAAQKHAEFKEQTAKMRAKFKKRNAKARAEMESSANANMTLMKDQMKKMAEEENVTAADLIEFMERNFPQLSPSISNPRALLESENRKRRRGT